MVEDFNFEKFANGERAKDAALDPLIADLRTLNTESLKQQITSLLDINYLFSKPFEKLDSFIAQTIERSAQLLSPLDSLDSLYYSLHHFFKDYYELIKEFLTKQFLENFNDQSFTQKLKDFFLVNPQTSLSYNVDPTNAQSILIHLFYQEPFLQSINTLIDSIIELEFDNYSLQLQDYIHQKLDHIVSLSSHLLSLEFSQDFETTLYATIIQHKCIHHYSHNLFTIVVSYPESQPRVTELKSLLNATQLTPSFEHFQYESETRLLHPGSSTTEILTYYLSAIQVIQTLDRPLRAIDLISDVIFAYLKGREDTFRCIISTFLTQKYPQRVSVPHDENVNPLLRLGNSTDGTHSLPSFFHSPEPGEAPPSSEDIVSVFTNIYGSKELFISEYRTLLADRIITKFEFDLTTELSNLSKLEAKFGESYFTYCQVMLKDIEFSLELQTIMSRKILNSPYQLAGYVLSHNFWPTFVEENLTVPIELQSVFKEFKREFEALKSRRTLEWRTNIGLVELEVSLNGRKIPFSVSPLQAIVLLQFKQRNSWVLKDLASMMKVNIIFRYRQLTKNVFIVKIFITVELG